ncbi:MAG: M28 family peptidase, partial [Cytophagales bacterium]|nr:M28 family peptidase [Armatimonadota bacterium]
GRSEALADTVPAPAAVRGAARGRTGYLAPAAAPTVADQMIYTAQLRDYLSFIASDELQGRDTPSNGLNTAARFLATHLSRWGFRPAGSDGTFFQKVPLVRTRLDSATSRAALGNRPLRYGSDYLLPTGQNRTAVATVNIADAPLVYVGHGWVLPRRGVDSYRGVNVRGKILVVNRRRLPKGYGGPDFAGAQNVQQYAGSHGALGIVYLAESEAAYTTLRTNADSPRGFAPVAPVAAPPAATPASAPAPAAVVLSPTASRLLLAGERLSAETALSRSASGEGGDAFDLAAGKKMRLALRSVTETVTTQNVVAVWEGGDPVLKNEYVALGAHYDHIGVATTPDARGDTIYNGADDDGSGTSAILAIADAFRQSPSRPRRSLLFVWHCGEEKGLWGSDFFTRNATVPLEQITAQLNIDMIGRSRAAEDTSRANARLSGPKEIYVIGSRMQSTQLGDLTARVNTDYQGLKYNYRYDDPKDPEGFFYRSDHYNYARRGIPIVFWFDGVHEDYHRRSDEISKIDFAKMTAVTRTVFLTAAELADLPARPVVDKPLVEQKENK